MDLPHFPSYNSLYFLGRLSTSCCSVSVGICAHSIKSINEVLARNRRCFTTSLSNSGLHGVGFVYRGTVMLEQKKRFLLKLSRIQLSKMSLHVVALTLPFAGTKRPKQTLKTRPLSILQLVGSLLLPDTEVQFVTPENTFTRVKWPHALLHSSPHLALHVGLCAAARAWKPYFMPHSSFWCCFQRQNCSKNGATEDRQFFTLNMIQLWEYHFMTEPVVPPIKASVSQYR